MKLIRSTLAAGLLVFGTAAIASAQAGTQNGAAASARQHGQFGKHGMKGGEGRALFHGIQLSAAEKANIKAVHAKYQPQMKALREQFKSARQKGDTAAIRAQRQQERQQVAQVMQSQQAELRNALTPANQAKFDANVQTAKQRFAARADKAKKRGRPGAGA